MRKIKGGGTRVTNDPCYNEIYAFIEIKKKENNMIDV